MCDKCKPIDDRIARHKFLQSAITDQKVVDAIAQLIHKLELQKKELHPNE